MPPIIPYFRQITRRNVSQHVNIYLHRPDKSVMPVAIPIIMTGNQDNST